MFSGNVFADVSDMHSIISLDTGKRINPPAPIVIEDHVWIARNVTIAKGVKIGANCVIGAGSVVTKDIEANCVAAGVPARILRRGITWDRRRL
ncbi:DapH/DapD/GlmU-related protein [Methylocystis sp. ATCC 49242]|uniref:DapH/DapD/GlmU-related protein n=1 Tax=Methylocystis sp. ATCC 49242 TaxID=622637 RepID=UPI00178C1C22|nr:DapH/DapD/GlmU-related protein [Methylocystis sp. ATCC 49242]